MSKIIFASTLVFSSVTSLAVENERPSKEPGMIVVKLNCETSLGRTLAANKEKCEAMGGTWIASHPEGARRKVSGGLMTEGIIIEPLNCRIEGLEKHVESKEDCEKLKGTYFEARDRSK